MKLIYSTQATVSGGREGKGRSDDGRLDLALSMPKEFGGPGGSGTNPEQLFAVGYAACFESALRMVARMQKKDPGAASVAAKVSMMKSDTGAFTLAVELRGKLPGLPRPEAEALMAAAHEVCPYSRATRGNIEVVLKVE